ncbi:organic cation transporter protein-like isoform X2 [Neocloeon triangulifer]|nr:organic cation transporter protein-like isoform X2 [Neocloeon triangulifer]
MADPKAREADEAQEENDVVADVIGEYGSWQLRLTFLLALFNIPSTWHIMAYTFQSLDRPFWCARPTPIRDFVSPSMWRNISQPGNSSCQIWSSINETFRPSDSPVLSGEISTCTQFEYDETNGTTLVAEWNLVCDRAVLVNVAEMTFLSGVAIGGLVSGIISDKFGRKRTLLISLFTQIVTGTIISFNLWLELYLVLRFFLGFSSVAVVFSAFVLCMELVGGKWRTISGVSFLFPVPLGYITVAGIAYVVREWRILQLAVTLPAVSLLAAIWVLPESPRWLLSMRKEEKLMAVLKRAAASNKRPIPTDSQKILAKAPPQEKGGDSVGVLTLFRTAQIRKISLVLYIVWFALYTVYYGLVLNLASIEGDIYLNTAISGFVEIPAIALSILLLMKSGRKWPLCIVTASSGVFCLCVLAVPTGAPSWITVALAMCGKFAISCSNAILPIFTAELFPTVVRNLGVGSSNVSAGIALMLVPYLWNLAVIYDKLPFIFMGVLGIVGGLSVMLLPETAGRPMPNTLEDLERRGNDIKNKAQATATMRSSSTTRSVVTRPASYRKKRDSEF